MSDQSKESATRRCVSLDQGNLSADMRVNYVFGLVLGVDEFTQEQHYHLNKNYLHHRGLHGYGAVSGLRVALKAVGEGDIEITVGGGLGVDQVGRTFAVREKQCARLKAWLKQPEQNDLTEDYASPSGDDGSKTLYVVAQYDSCETEQVPIAGEPCGTGEENRAPSRIKDTIKIELREKENTPNMAAWAAVQRFARLLSDIEIDPASNVRNEDLISNHLGKTDGLEDFLQGLVQLGKEKLKLSQADFNQVMNIWISRVRPRLEPPVLDPNMENDAAILLARIDFKATEESTTEEPRFEIVGVDHSNRPYLLHTQLIQSLLSHGGETLSDVRNFVQFKTFSGEKNTVYFYLEPENLTVLDVIALEVHRNKEDNPLPSELTPSGDREDLLWQVKMPEAGLKDGDVLFFSFDTDQFQVEDGKTLTEWMEEENVYYIGYDGDHHINAIHVMETQPEQESEGVSKDEVFKMIDAVRTLPLVTITPLAYNIEQSIVYELWFHVDMQPDQYQGEVIDPTVNLFLEAQGRRLLKADTRIEKVRPNLFRLTATQEAMADIPDQLYYARFVFPLKEGTRVENSSGAFDNLSTFMKEYNIKFDGYYMELEGEGQVLVLYERLPVNMEVG